MVQVRQFFAPQNQAILLWLRVVLGPRRRDRETETLVEAPGGEIGFPHLQGCPPDTRPGSVHQHMLHEEAAQSLAPEWKVDDQGVDVQFVEEEPARAEG